MVSRRHFLAFLAGIASTGKSVASLVTPSFVIGVTDASLIGHMAKKNAPLLFDTMASTFEVDGKPKPTFLFGDYLTLTKNLIKGDIHLLIATGLEYAWLQKDHSDLIPTVIAYSDTIAKKACIAVNASGPFKSFRDLHHRSIALPQRLQHHAYIYLDSLVTRLGKEPLSFFKSVSEPLDADAAIESVIDGKADGVLLDNDSWRGYKERKPARSKKIRVIDDSPEYPTGVILRSPKTWSDQDLSLLKSALCHAHERPFPRQVLNFWQINKFVEPTEQYIQLVHEVARSTPYHLASSFVAK